MGSNFREDISDSNRFVITAVTITDNPGGHPSLSPDVLGREIVNRGMDVIVHFTCRDQNRVGIESRALQLGHLGIKNVLALTGDFAGEGFAGQGAPVFDLDSVSLLLMLKMMDEGTLSRGDREDFLVGCAFSPFKRTEEESQTEKRLRSRSAGDVCGFLYSLERQGNRREGIDLIVSFIELFFCQRQGGGEKSIICLPPILSGRISSDFRRN